MGQKQKTEKKERKKERGERDRTMVIAMASYALQRHLVWRTQSCLGQNLCINQPFTEPSQQPTFHRAFTTATYLHNITVKKEEMKFKLLFIAFLFSVFVWQFAIPSFQKYLTAGVMVDKSWRRRQPEDSPTVTFCARNNNTGLGWKSMSKTSRDPNMTAIDLQCNNPETVDDALDCLNKETFNLTETIKSA